uniref:t-SNARE coiled-coil homology domain-containing protein n=1 Tax=Varanus komodoensis TaxID=61221 RepID=A0A8D2IP61_VARKO
MDQIIQDMKEAEKNLTDMAKCCGLFVCPPSLAGPRAPGVPPTGVPSAPAGIPAPPRNPSPFTGPCVFLFRVTKDDVEEEIEQNLTQVDSMLSNLRSMAVDMSNEIDVQSKQVDSIKDKAVANVISINAANNQTTKMLKKA